MAALATDRRPNLEAEMEGWRAGARWIAGLDEVGRGALAGPVVAGAVVLPCAERSAFQRLADVRDSKLMTAPMRCRAYSEIVATAVGVGIGAVSARGIDALGIARATRLAMLRAIAALPVVPDRLLVDGLRIPLSDYPQRAIVGGDRKVLSIAAASVVAKLHRDALMVELSSQLPDYGFDQHKGYATARHRRAIEHVGPCRYHRLTWAPLRGAHSLRVVRQGRLPGPFFTEGKTDGPKRFVRTAALTGGGAG